MIFVKADDFKEFLNPLHITRDSPDIVLVEKNTPKIHDSSILIRSERNHNELVTINFTVRFKHHEHQEGGNIFQREISIEHHPTEESRHDQPHLQFHIHGVNPGQKVGKLWLTLNLENDSEYERCIEGFFSVLADIAQNCRPALDDELLNKPEVKKLAKQRISLWQKTVDSLRTRGAEYEFPDGHRETIYIDDIKRITSQDRTLVPLLEKPD